MKITFEVPDNTRAVILSIVYGYDTEMMLGSKSIGSDEIKDGAVIQWEAYDGD